MHGEIDFSNKNSIYEEIIEYIRGKDFKPLQLNEIIKILYPKIYDFIYTNRPWWIVYNYLKKGKIHSAIKFVGEKNIFNPIYKLNWIKNNMSNIEIGGIVTIPKKEILERDLKEFNNKSIEEYFNDIFKQGVYKKYPDKKFIIMSPSDFDINIAYNYYVKNKPVTYYFKNKLNLISTKILYAIYDESIFTINNDNELKNKLIKHFIREIIKCFIYYPYIFFDREKLKKINLDEILFILDAELLKKRLLDSRFPKLYKIKNYEIIDLNKVIQKIYNLYGCIVDLNINKEIYDVLSYYKKGKHKKQNNIEELSIYYFRNLAATIFKGIMPKNKVINRYNKEIIDYVIEMFFKEKSLIIYRNTKYFPLKVNKLFKIIIKETKNKSIIFEIFNNYNFSKIIYLTELFSDKPVFYNLMTEFVKKYKKRTTYLFPLLLFEETYTLEVLIDIFENWNNKNIYTLLEVLKRFRNIINDNKHYIHDLVYFLDRDDDTYFEVISHLYYQLSPKSSSFNDDLENIVLLYNSAKRAVIYDFPEIIDKIKSIKNVNNIKKYISAINNLIVKKHNSKISEFLQKIRHIDNDEKKNYTSLLLMNVFKTNNFIDLLNNFDKYIKNKEFYKEATYQTDEFNVYFCNWDSYYGFFAPDCVYCCAGVEYNKFYKYLKNKYTYNLTIIDRKNNNIIAWSLLVIGIDENNKKYLILDNIEVKNNTKYINLLEKNFKKIIDIIFDYVKKLEGIEKNKIFIGIRYNDIKVEMFADKITRNIFPLEDIGYSDAFYDENIYVIRRT